MRKSLLYKLFSLILVSVILVSCNLVAATTLTSQNSHDGNPRPSLGAQSSVTNHAAETVSAQTDYGWTASALYSYADNTGNLEVIVGVDSSTSSYNTVSALTSQNGGKITDTLHMGQESALVIELSTSTAPQFVTQVRSSGVSTYIEPNGKYQVDSTVNDPYYNLQWGLKRVNADAAWDTTVGSSDLLVAVIDTGIDYTHPDLKSNYVPLGYDFFNNDNDPLDDYGHGTHCAGVIAAAINNGLGIAGVAQVKIMAEKGLGADGLGSYVALANCIIHATNAGAKILSNSWGGPVDSSLISHAVAYATAHGALVIGAAGNDNVSQPFYPGAYDDVVAVAASNTTDTKASFSNYGSWVDVAAPGVMIYSTMPTYNVTMYSQPRFTQTYSYMNGTSMACPMAAGVAALIWSKYPTMTAEFVREQLESTCDDAGAAGFDQYFGYGIVNAQKGVEQSPTLHDLAAKSWIKPSYIMLGAAQTFNLTAINRGLLDETNVHVNLLVNGVMVNSTTISSLQAYKTASVALSWTPSTIGSYNITFTVAPSTGETNFNNNQLSTAYTVVAPPNQTNWTQLTTNPDTNTGCNLKSANSQLHDGTVFFKLTYYHPWNKASEDIDTGIMIDTDQNISTGMPLDFYPDQKDFIGTDCMIMVGREGNAVWMWNQTIRSFDKNNPLNILYLEAPDNSSTFVVGVSADDLRLTGAFDCSFNDIVSFGVDGVWDWMPDAGYVPFCPQPTQHDLTVTLDTLRIYEPNLTYTLTANVHNYGQANETGVNFQLIINREVVNSTSIATLPSGQVQSVTFTWHPTEGYYNITAYAAPLGTESFVSNNVRSHSVSTFQKIAVISDSTELWTTLNLLDEMGINYDYYSNTEQIYTAQASLLNQYPVVIFYNNARNITATEASVLNGYLAQGGRLLVTGLDSTAYTDSKLARVVRVVSSGDDYKANDLIVANTSHAIMNGPYGNFAAGYNVTGLNIDNDAVIADRSRNAMAVARLTDGYAKIVATDSLPGKVVYWNGIGPDNWLNNADCEAMFKNTMLWFLDESAPITTTNYDGAWHSTSFTVQLVAYDYFGVNQTYYKVNGGQIKTIAADGQPMITTEGVNNTLEYWSTDLYGHVEAHKFLQQIKLDKTAPAASFTINSGAKYANTQDVTLSLNATDATALSMRFSNDNATWTTWTNYTAIKAWALTGADGNKTVYAQFKDQAGLTATVYSSIILDATAPTVDAGSSRTVNLTDNVAFDGSSSYDANGIVSYMWLFGDGTQGSGAKVSNVYGSVDTFTVKLTVTDAAGNTASASVKVAVEFKPAATPTPTPTVTPTPTTQPTITPSPTPTSTATPIATATEAPMMGVDSSLWIISVVAVVAFCLGAAFVFVWMRQRAKSKP
jgi:thermitase